MLSPGLLFLDSQDGFEDVLMVIALHSFPPVGSLRHLVIQVCRLLAGDWLKGTPLVMYWPLVALHGNHIPGINRLI